jgi:hypothetical protein
VATVATEPRVRVVDLAHGVVHLAAPDRAVVDSILALPPERLALLRILVENAEEAL